MPLIQLVGDSIDCRPIIAARAALVGTRAAVVSAARIPTAAAELEEIVHLWGREICLSGLSVLLVERDSAAASGGEGVAQSRAFMALFERLAGPLALCECERSRVAHRLLMPFDVAPPPTTEQHQAWRQAFEQTAKGRMPSLRGTTIDEAGGLLTAQFRLGPPAIAAISAEALAETR